jgi:ABC-type amino acid transport system permease subunit
MKFDVNQIAGYVWQGLWLTVGYKLATFLLGFLPGLMAAVPR